MACLEDLRGEIYFRYIAQNETLDELMENIERLHGINFSKKQYNDSLSTWGYRSKRIQRATAVAVMREKARRELAGRDSIFYSRAGPIDMQKVERHCQKNKPFIGAWRYPDASQQPVEGQVVCKTPPPVQRPLQLPLQLWISEKVLHELDMQIRSSFKSCVWKFFDNERLIESSDAASEEQRRLMTFQCSIDQGCTAAKDGNITTAFDKWQKSFEEVEYLLQGTFHDVIYNMIFKINDLSDLGFSDIASSLVNHISKWSQIYKNETYFVPSVFLHLEGVDLDCLSGLEDSVSGIFHSLFYFHLGYRCYNTFVMEINRAKRKLTRDDSSDIDQYLPPLSTVEEIFGPLNRRSLDVIRVCLEVLYHREQYEKIIPEALNLVERADKKQDDPWQRHYFLVKGLYYSGSAHYRLGNKESARQHYMFALWFEEEFWKYDGTNQFSSLRLLMNQRLRLLNTEPSARISSG